MSQNLPSPHTTSLTTSVTTSFSSRRAAGGPNRAVTEQVALRVENGEGRAFALTFDQKLVTQGVGLHTRMGRDPYAEINATLATEAMGGRVLQIRRWTIAGVWENLFKALSHDQDFEYVLVDATICKPHADATPQKGG